MEYQRVELRVAAKIVTGGRKADLCEETCCGSAENRIVDAAQQRGLGFVGTQRIFPDAVANHGNGIGKHGANQPIVGKQVGADFTWSFST